MRNEGAKQGGCVADAVPLVAGWPLPLINEGPVALPVPSSQTDVADVQTGEAQEMTTDFHILPPNNPDACQVCGSDQPHVQRLRWPMTYLEDATASSFRFRPDHGSAAPAPMPPSLRQCSGQCLNEPTGGPSSCRETRHRGRGDEPSLDQSRGFSISPQAGTTRRRLGVRSSHVAAMTWNSMVRSSRA